MGLTYVCSPLSAPTRAEMLANAAKASTYMVNGREGIRRPRGGAARVLAVLA